MKKKNIKNKQITRILHVGWCNKFMVNEFYLKNIVSTEELSREVLNKVITFWYIVCTKWIYIKLFKYKIICEDKLWYCTYTYNRKAKNFLFSLCLNLYSKSSLNMFVFGVTKKLSYFCLSIYSYIMMTKWNHIICKYTWFHKGHRKRVRINNNMAINGKT